MRVGLVDLDQQPEPGDLALDGAGREQLRVGDDRGTTVHTKRVADARDDEQERDVGVLEHVRERVGEAVARPVRQDSVRSSRMRTNPAGSPRGLTSQVPSPAAVARQRNGERSTNRRVTSFSRSLTFCPDERDGLAEQRSQRLRVLDRIRHRYPSSLTSSRRSRAKKWVPSTKRTSCSACT